MRPLCFIGTAFFFTFLSSPIQAQIGRCADTALANGNIADALSSGTSYATGCPNGVGVVPQGIPSMLSLVCLFELESLSVINRNVPVRSAEEQAVYKLCPETTYNVTGGNWLLAVLDGTKYQCGNDGNVHDNCVVTGGPIHVLLEDNPPEVEALAPNQNTIRNVVFEGITFRGASTGSIFARASSKMTVEFINCRFEGSESVLLLAEEDEASRKRRGLRLGQQRTLLEDLSTPKSQQHIEQEAQHAKDRIQRNAVVHRDILMQHEPAAESTDNTRSLQQPPEQQTGQNVIFHGCTIEGTLPLAITGGSGATNTAHDEEEEATTFDFVIEGGTVAMMDTTYGMTSRTLPVFAQDSFMLWRNVTVAGVKDSLVVAFYMGGETVIENCMFTESEVVAAIYQSGGRLLLQRSTFDVDAVSSRIDAGAGVVARDGAELTMLDNCFVGGSYEFPVFVSKDVVVTHANSFLSSNYLSDDLDTNCTGLFTADPECFETENECPGFCMEFSTTLCSADRATDSPSSVPTTFVTESPISRITSSPSSAGAAEETSQAEQPSSSSPAQVRLLWVASMIYLLLVLQLLIREY